MPGEGDCREEQRGGQLWDGHTFGNMAGQCMSHREWQREHMDPKHHQGKTTAGKPGLSKGGSCPPTRAGWSREAMPSSEMVPEPLHSL